MLAPLVGNNPKKVEGLRPGTSSAQWGEAKVGGTSKEIKKKNPKAITSPKVDQVHVKKEVKFEGGVDPNYINAICHHILEKEKQHNLISVDGDSKEKTLCYEAQEAGVVGGFIMKHCFSQMYMLHKGVKVFGNEGVAAAKDELKQLHNRTCWRAITVKQLSRRERERAMECLMFLTEKKSKEIKGRLAYNGKPIRDWIT